MEMEDKTAPKPKRRMVLGAPSTPAVSAGDIAVQPVVALAAGESATLGCRRAPTEYVQNAEQLGALLAKEAEQAMRTHAQWARSPTASWIQDLLSELGATERSTVLAKQRKLQTFAADDFAAQWEHGSEVASLIVELWLVDKTADDVLAKCRLFGHTEMRGGLVLTGRLVQKVAAATSLTVPALVEMVTALSARPGAPATAAAAAVTGSSAASTAATAAGASAAADGDADTAAASVFVVERDNHFVTEGGTSSLGVPRALERELESRLRSGEGGLGCLSSTHDYGQEEGGGASGVALLDELWASLDDISYVMGEAAVSPGILSLTQSPILPYATALAGGTQSAALPDLEAAALLHALPPGRARAAALYAVQSGAREPACFEPCDLSRRQSSLCWQVSGVSTFHFLPVLLGLYASHVGRTRGPAALASLLSDLQSRGIGEVATIGPAQMLLILPTGAHGVFVPPQLANPDLRPHTASSELSVIRAAEMFVRPVCTHYETLLGTDGGHLLPLTAEERVREVAELDRFADEQDEVRPCVFASADLPNLTRAVICCCTALCEASDWARPVVLPRNEAPAAMG